MARRTYSPRSFFRHCRNEDLRLYFHHKNLLLDFDFDGLKGIEKKAVYEAWLALPDQARAETVIDFHAITDLASDDGIEAILTEARWQGHRVEHPDDADLAIRLAAMSDHFARAIWVFCERPRYWKGAIDCHSVDMISDSAWVTVKELPAGEYVATRDQLGELQRLIGDNFFRKHSKGRNCHIDPYHWKDEEVYCCYPEDFATSSPEWGSGQFVRRTHRPAFEIIIRHNGREGTLAIKAKGGRKVVKEMQDIFAQVIFGLDELPIPASAERVYDMDRFKNPTIAIPTELGISELVVTGMTVLPHDGSNDKVTIRSGLKNGSRSLYQSLRNDMRGRAIDRGGGMVGFSILRVEMEARFVAVDGKRPKRRPFFVGWPNKINLGHDQWDLAIRQLLRDNGFEPVAPETLGHAADVA